MNALFLRRTWQLVRYLGPAWLMYRVSHFIQIKSGFVRFKSPAKKWSDQPLSYFLTDPLLTDVERYAQYRDVAAPLFFFEPNSIPEFQPHFAKWDSPDCMPLASADDVAKGFVRFFSNERTEVGFPPRWHTDPFSKASFPSDRHWSQIGDFSAGDIKLVWETNRFGFAYALVRSYWRSGDEQYAELFWQIVENWYLENPPETGVNWKCGQEISLRVMAWCFGLYGFGAATATTPSRVAMIAQMIVASGRHIESHIDYALSQKNNHGVSEALGLWTIGTLFPEFRDSSRWELRGRQLLESQARTLIYDDGTFSQHSMNYHRVMLHDYLWCMRLGDIQGRPFSHELRQRIAQASEFLYQVQDDVTGQVPCYGHDDGALILPLNNCGYRDYRPIIQATQFLISGKLRFESGPWDEDLLWLFGSQSLSRTKNTDFDLPSSEEHRSIEMPTNVESISRTDFEAREGGYVTLRSAHGFAMTRSARFRHRPAQADMLHVDIWWRGVNIAIDPGTFSYNAPVPWNNSLALTACHNTVNVDNRNQMDAANRFLWLPWLKGTSFGQRARCRGDVSCWNGEHDGYRRLADPVYHRRGLVRLGSDHWLIVDSLEGKQPHSFKLHWLLLDAPYTQHVESQSVELQTPMGRYAVAMACSPATSNFDVVRASSDSNFGWRSSHYHSREPAISIDLESTSNRVVFATVFGPEAMQPLIVDNRIMINGSVWNVIVSLNLDQSSGIPVVASVEGKGSLSNDDFIDLPDADRSIPELHLPRSSDINRSSNFRVTADLR